MTAVDEVVLPGGHDGARSVAVLGAEHVAHERGQRVGVGRRGSAEDQAIAELTNHGRLLAGAGNGEDIRSPKN
jgi:hypothetical protein